MFVHVKPSLISCMGKMEELQRAFSIALPCAPTREVKLELKHISFIEFHIRFLRLTTWGKLIICSLILNYEGTFDYAPL